MTTGGKIALTVSKLTLVVFGTAFAVLPLVYHYPYSDVKAVVFDDRGGVSKDYEDFVKSAEDTLVQVYGHCDSACVRKLGAKRFCMGPLATFATHEARRVYRESDYAYEKGTRSEVATQNYRMSIPPCARALFDARDGFASTTVVTISGAAIRAACPQLHLCDNTLTYWRYSEEKWRVETDAVRKFGREFYR